MSGFHIDPDTRRASTLPAAIQEFNLPDESKSVRCLINFANDPSVDRGVIFGEVRCPEC